MKFWRGNEVAREFDMPVAEVAAQYMDWFREHREEADEIRRRCLPTESLLRWWLTSGEHFNSVWEAEHGDESFDRLWDIVHRETYSPAS
jgi:hypothetical protein